MPQSDKYCTLLAICMNETRSNRAQASLLVMVLWIEILSSFSLIFPILSPVQLLISFKLLITGILFHGTHSNSASVSILYLKEHLKFHTLHHQSILTVNHILWIWYLYNVMYGKHHKFERYSVSIDQLSCICKLDI